MPNERIVYSNEMYLDKARTTVSVATVQLEADDGGTHLTLTEQGAYLDGFENPGQREAGTKELLNALGRRSDPRPVPQGASAPASRR